MKTRFCMPTSLLPFLTLLVAILTFPVSAQEPEFSYHRDAQLEMRLAELQSTYQELRQEREDLEQQYEVLQGSRMLHRILQEARASVREVRQLDYDEQLAQLRLALFTGQRQLRDDTLLGQQREALDMQVSAIEQEISLLVEFMQTQSQLVSELAAFEVVLAEYLFWTPSNREIGIQWLRELPALTLDQFRRILGSIGELSGQLSVQLTPLMAIWVVLLALFLLKRPLIRKRLKQYDEDVRSNKASSPWLIPSALGLHALMVAPPSLLVLIAAQFINAPVGNGIDLDQALNAVAGALFVVSLLLRLLRPNGFTSLYYQWDPAQCKAMRSFMRWLAWGLVPLSFALAVSSQQTTQIGGDVLGQILLMAAAVYLSIIIIALFKRLPYVYGSKVIHRLVGAALMTLPITLLLIVFNGYFYTALMMSGYYLATFYVIAVWLLVESGVQRWIDFSYDRMREQQREQVLRSSQTPVFSEDGVDMGMPLTPTPAVVTPTVQPLQVVEIEEPTSDLSADVRQRLDNLAKEAGAAKVQSQRLARFGLMILFAFILFQIWSEATSALEYLDNWFLWADPETGVGALSLGGILTALGIAIVGIVMVKNLPGLLEMTVLSKMKLQVGTSYAVISLVNYALISIAIIAFLASLGVRWDQLQWLAAGLTVGLGFGLQEIFGNFISGLILFFERPLRVGDVVTLNNLSGRVSQIRIRATIITDFDRRDILVPNRQFITGQFVNWTLSNTITRITVRVGVAYGSDLEKTRELLIEIARDEPRVLAEPAPMALFLTFGESTLDHELRVHVNALGDRNPTIDAINRQIDKRFKEAGIEIAFNQVDVHFRNELGIERHIAQHTHAPEATTESKPASPTQDNVSPPDDNPDVGTNPDLDPGSDTAR